jgi:predicted RND superfamily exporter protein
VAFSDKQIKKYELVKYTRELERYLNRIVKYIRQDGVTQQEFTKYIDDIFRPLENIKKVVLISEYLKELEKFVEYSANLPTSQDDICVIKKDILHRANTLQKIKKSRNRSTKKHNKIDWSEYE